MRLLRSRSNIWLGLSSMTPPCRWSGSLWEDTIHHRRLCGEGDLNPPAFIKAVQAAGYRGYYGVEILSEEHRKLPLEEMARRSFETTMEQFKKLAPQSGEGRAGKS